jgi:hypothetical protein
MAQHRAALRTAADNSLRQAPLEVRVESTNPTAVGTREGTVVPAQLTSTGSWQWSLGAVAGVLLAAMGWGCTRRRARLLDPLDMHFLVQPQHMAVMAVAGDKDLERDSIEPPNQAETDELIQTLRNCSSDEDFGLHVAANMNRLQPPLFIRIQEHRVMASSDTEKAELQRLCMRILNKMEEVVNVVDDIMSKQDRQLQSLLDQCRSVNSEFEDPLSAATLARVREGVQALLPEFMEDASKADVFFNATNEYQSKAEENGHGAMAGALVAIREMTAQELLIKISHEVVWDDKVEPDALSIWDKLLKAERINWDEILHQNIKNEIDTQEFITMLDSGVSDIIFSRYANGSPAQQALTNTVYLLLEHLAILTGTDPEKGKELKADFDAEKAKEDEQEKGMQWY